MNNAIKTFLMEEDGLTTVEYAIAGALVGAAVIASFGLLGDAVDAIIVRIYTDLNAA
jgi:pilus assembly protein Flp/PilA